MNDEQRRALNGEPISREDFERMTGYTPEPWWHIWAFVAALAMYTAFALSVIFLT